MTEDLNTLVALFLEINGPWHFISAIEIQRLVIFDINYLQEKVMDHKKERHPQY